MGFVPCNRPPAPARGAGHGRAPDDRRGRRGGRRRDGGGEHGGAPTHHRAPGRLQKVLGSSRAFILFYFILFYFILFCFIFHPREKDSTRCPCSPRAPGRLQARGPGFDSGIYFILFYFIFPPPEKDSTRCPCSPRAPGRLQPANAAALLEV